MKNKLITISIVLLVFIISTITVSIILINSNNYLKSFNIISVENISTKYKIKFEKVKAAKYYDVIIYNDASEIFYNETFTTNNIEIDLKNINYNDTYRLVIFAIDKNNDSITVNNPYEFTYQNPTISKENSLILIDNKDYVLDINGNINAKEFIIVISDGTYIIKKEKLKSNKYTISSQLFTNSKQKLNVSIYDGINKINEIDLYNNLSPISDLKITTPSNDITLDYDDVVVNYEGGTNATKFVMELYKGTYLLKEQEIEGKKFIISSEFFDKSEKYTIKLKAYYKDFISYTKEASITFTMNEKDTLKPAFINQNYKYVEINSQLVINNPNNDGTIYYTLDGSDPNENGTEYKEPINVDKNIILKTIVKAPKKNNSIVREYNINIGTKKEYRVYLSPSNQSGNIGVKSVGYTNEAAEMNDLTDYIETILKENGVKVYRNNPNGNINLWTADSRFYNVDLHLAIHSNASTDHTASGIETWVNEPSCAAYDLANIIQNDLWNIYYNKEDITKNRGVKYANNSLGEVNTRFVPLGILVEVAHHDYLEDASWIMTNKKLIGNTIANSILKYFDII